ncbi:MAG: UDP-N-acetylglucosamine--N-acetylmuramyl-(pentapeptide) pyrophosphoryl-undecaprenol N-acetylglucosamine transferase [Chloroflexota bacterium]|nr:UDP-N-acetylglucosamine--N-acetylmuramyl-(pentapeptide) pyrophosphoryl-undecaprenol N-acetylglucosamine transferase [Chloroflexota bacterium]
MRLLLTGGGTGGHLYPALVVLDWLRAAGAPIEPLWVGSGRGLEREIVERVGVRYVSLPVGALRGRSPVGMARGLFATMAGVRAALRLLESFRPAVVLATGGYVSAPAVLAARLRAIPSLVYLPDVVPGWAVRFLSRVATVVAASTPEARAFLAREVVVTGYPVRPGFRPREAAAARRELGLAPDGFTVTVVGGSLGARRLNEAVLAGLEQLLERGQVIHLTGQADYDRVAAARKTLPPHWQTRYHPAAYLEAEMPAALAAADLIVSRAGASVLGEYPAVGRGSLLVPGPFSSQIKNAEYLARKGASVLLPNERADELPATVLALAAMPDCLARMATAARALARPDAAAALGGLVLELGKQ